MRTWKRVTVVILSVLTACERTSRGSSEPVRPATWSDDGRRLPAPAGGTE